MPCTASRRCLERLERKLGEENGVTLGPDRALIVTAGGNMAFMNAVLAITDPGDEVIITAPYYFNHEMAITIAGAGAVIVPTDANYQLRPGRPGSGHHAAHPRDRHDLAQQSHGRRVSAKPICGRSTQSARRHGIYHICDEAYEYFTWDGAVHFSPASIPGSEGHTIGLYSLSKSYGFASWRIGYMVVPRKLFEPIRKIQDTNLICPPVISQWAAVGALGGGAAILPPSSAAMAAARRGARRASATPATFVPCRRRHGAFYLLLNVPTAMDSMQLGRAVGARASCGGHAGLDVRRDRPLCMRVSYGPLRAETAQEGIGRLIGGLRAILKE